MSARASHNELLALETLELIRAAEDQADLLVGSIILGGTTPRVLTKPAAIARFLRRPSINWLPDYESDRNVCGLCNAQDPPLFDVPDACWRHYVPRQHRERILCIACWSWLVEIIDGGRFETQHGGPLPLWSDAWRARHGIAVDEPCPLDDEQLRHFTIQAAPSPRRASS